VSCRGTTCAQLASRRIGPSRSLERHPEGGAKATAHRPDSLAASRGLRITRRWVGTVAG
jgi:hypothetical protein